MPGSERCLDYKGSGVTEYAIKRGIDLSEQYNLLHHLCIVCVLLIILIMTDYYKWVTGYKDFFGDIIDVFFSLIHNNLSMTLDMEHERANIKHVQYYDCPGISVNRATLPQRYSHRIDRICATCISSQRYALTGFVNILAKKWLKMH